MTVRPGNVPNLDRVPATESIAGNEKDRMTIHKTGVAGRLLVAVWGAFLLFWNAEEDKAFHK